MIRILVLIPLLLASIGCTTHTHPLLQTTAPAASTYDWNAEIGSVFKMRGELKDDVYTITIPRNDLDVKIDGMSVPTAAGIFSTFRFYHCSCGKISVLGEFICEDFEANDVIETLHVGSVIRLAGMGPIALGDKPRLISIRFHGEGEGPDLAKRIQAGLRWTGEARSKPMPLNK